MELRKSHALVEYLARQERAVTAKELAVFLNFSTRTVKNYISAINQEAAHPFIFSGRNGYEIDPAEGRKYLLQHRDLEREVPQNYEERANFINQRFLKYHVNRLKLYDLSEELNYSEETIRSDIRKMNNSFESFGVSYEIHSDEIWMIADEKSLRRLARYCLFDSTQNRIITYASIKAAFREIDVPAVKMILEQTLLKYDLYVNDFSLINMVLHLVVVIWRLTNQNTLSADSGLKPDRNEPAYLAAQEICRRFRNVFHLEFNAEEEQNIYLLLKANANFSVCDNRAEIARFVGEDLLQFVEKLIAELDAKYYVSLAGENFLYPFSMHIKNLLFRAQNRQHNINPMCQIIQYSHPMIFDMAVYAALLLNEKYGVKPDENEISYLALHIGGEMERQEDSRKKIRTVLLCPNYLEFSTKISNQLLISFGNEIELLACVSTEEQLKRYRFELLVTTIEPEKRQTDYTTVYVPMLGIGKCRHEIGQAIEKTREKRRNRILRTEFTRVFSPRLFFVNREPDLTPEEIMRVMAARMEAEGVVQKDFFERLLQREAAASTAFANIAIPHSMRMDAIKTSICVMLCPEGVRWGEKYVKIVMAIAVHKTDMWLFGELYQALISLFDHEKNLRRIVTQNTFEAFSRQMEQLIQS